MRMRDAIGDDARLARTRPRQDQQRSSVVQHRFALLRVQLVKERHRREW